MKKILFCKDYINRFIKLPLFSGSLVMVGGSMGVNAVNYLYHVLMGRILGPIDYGILASLYSIIYLVGIVPISAGIAIVKFISSAKSQDEVYSIYSSLRRFVFFIALVTLVILFIASPVIARFLNINNFWLVSLVSLILFFILLTLVNQATSQGLLKFFGSVGPNLVSALIKLILGVILVILGWSVFGAMVGVVMASFISYLFSFWFLRRFLKERKTYSYDLRPFLKYSFPVLIQALAFTSLFTIDVILVKHFLPAFQAGIYAALSTLGKIIFFAASPITATMFPIVSGRKARGEGYRKIFLVSFVATILLSVAIVVFYWLFPDIAIGVLYGKAYLSARTELVWMGVFILFYTLSSLLVNFSLSLGKTRVVVLPLVGALIQIFFIWFVHNSLLQVIQISLLITIALFISISIYLGYNRREIKYG